jgi:hypothetical protein
VVVPLAPQFALAQSSPPSQKAPRPPPPPPPPAATDQEQFLSYWTTEAGWRTELQLRNNQVGQTLAVTPVLRTVDGVETPLSRVVVQPQEVKTVDVATEIGNSAPQLIGTYGSLSLRYHTPGQGALYAVSMVMGVGHSIAFHIDATGEDETENVGSREGIWWLPNTTANDYLVLINHGQNPLLIALSLFDARGKASIQNLTLPPRGTNRLSVGQLVAAAGLAGSYGGIKVSATTHAGSLDTLHVLFDQTAGFSAVMKMFYYDPRTQVKERDYAGTGTWTLRAPMLALSNPDPALAFPVGTILHPQLLVRNTTSKHINAFLTFNWRSDSASGKSPSQTLQLNPYETRRVDVAAFQDGETLPQNAPWTSVILVTSGLPDEVMAVAASYDQALKYGAQTPFSDQLSHHWAGGEWQYDAYHNSIITVGNGGAMPAQAAFTIFYNQGTQRYDREQNLQPGEQMWMDIGKLIRENAPDKNGKTLPKDLTSGSYEFRDLTNTGMGTLFEGKIIYDKTYGHVTYGCATCCGYNAATLWYNPIVLAVQGSPVDDGVWGYSVCDQQYEDVSNTFYGNWSSANTSIVTVNSYGVHTPQSVGSTTSSTSGYLESTAHYPICPAKYFPPSGAANDMNLSCSPSSVTRGGSVTCSVSSAPSGAQYSNWQFKDSNNNIVNGSGTAGSWSGVVVTGGTVTVFAAGTQLTAAITVTARSGFGFTAVSPTLEPNNSSPSPTCTLSVQSPPVTNSFLGLSCLTAPSSFNDAAVSDSGPNQGYHYVTSVSSSFQGTPTGYYYVISSDLSNTSSAFYKAQTGTYNKQTNPNGYISGSNLLTDATRHESGTVNSHYQNYVAAQNNPQYNLGVVGEAETGSPNLSTANFRTQVNNDLNSAKDSVQTSTALQPCNSQYVYYDATCTFQGYINYNF